MLQVSCLRGSPPHLFNCLLTSFHRKKKLIGKHLHLQSSLVLNGQLGICEKHFKKRFEIKRNATEKYWALITLSDIGQQMQWNSANKHIPWKLKPTKPKEGWGIWCSSNECSNIRGNTGLNCKPSQKPDLNPTGNLLKDCSSKIPCRNAVLIYLSYCWPYAGLGGLHSKRLPIYLHKFPGDF